MSKKKSYMDTKNILSEASIFDIFKLFKFADKAKKEKLSKKEKALLKNPKIAKELAKFKSIIQKGHSDVRKQAAAIGLDLDK